MQSFLSLYRRLLKAELEKRLDDELERLAKEGVYSRTHLDCLLNPKIHLPVIKLAKCHCTDEEKAKCEQVCFFNAITHDDHGEVVISGVDCVGCGDCIVQCEKNNLLEIKETIPIFEAINRGESSVFVMIAPAYISQYSEAVTPGKLRTAFKRLGFAGMIEVALFADILTLKEALEFDKSIHSDKDYMLASCCCPMWIAMIKKVYHELVPHLPPSVSPMVACGKVIKKLHKNAITVFVGPCIAKKAEAREKDIGDAVDYVLTFEEVREIFEAANINPVEMDEDLKDHASKAGRTYAVTSGVSEAVKNTLAKLRPERDIPFKAQYADGVKGCKAMLQEILDGTIQANFIEGMGCVGGCVGGPKSLIDKNKAADYVKIYGENATFETPVDNPYVLELLDQLGFDTVEKLLEEDNLFIRDFSL